MDTKYSLLCFFLLAIFCGKQIFVECDPKILPKCPLKHLIMPCTCQDTWFVDKTQIICNSKILTYSILSKILKNSKEYACQEFILQDSKTLYIPVTIFKFKQLVQMKIIRTSMVSLFDVIPPNNNHLNYMLMDGVQLTNGMEWEFLAPLNKLQILEILHVHIPTLDETFARLIPAGLRKLKFENCSTTQFDDFAFSALKHLQEFSYVTGNITELKRSMFCKEVKKLTVFRVRGCRIQSLPEDMFSFMPKLICVDLGHNMIKSLPENTYGAIFPKLGIFDAGENPLKCGCDVLWITKVSRPLILEGSCNVPTEKTSLSLNDLKARHFASCD